MALKSNCDGVIDYAAPLALALAAALVLASPQAQAASFPLAPDQVLVGTPGVYVTREEDTLHEVARRNDLGYGQLMAVNRDIDPWLPGAGRSVTLPGVYLVPDRPRRGIVINLAEQRLYYFPPDGRTLETYPIGVGAVAQLTPLGTTQVIKKEVRPTWFPPPSIRAEKPELPEMVPPGPANPLGEYALRLGWPAYLIHGTNKPYGVGRNVSHGCIRLYPEDIERVFSEAAVGTPVRVIDEEIRLAWVAGELFLAVTPSRRQMDEIDFNQPMTPDVPPDLIERVSTAAGGEVGRVDWRIVEEIGLKRPGLPLQVTRSSISVSKLQPLP
ncbi:MAG TPA: L,D-transpeptidase family protein [Stellaceae bacterium]|nr:L,D-transpeptidase family protein [Stellaceae bacterium]